MDKPKIRILLIEDNKDFAKLVQVYLQRYERDLFDVTWKENYEDAADVFDGDRHFDVILMDYFLPGKNGLEITKELIARKVTTPIVFLTVNTDFEVALDVMKLGVADYLVKEEISSPVLPMAVLGVLEKKRLRDQLVGIEVSRQRLKAIHDTLSGIFKDFDEPLADMAATSVRLRQVGGEAQKNYMKIIEDNIRRMMDKLEKLKTLKEDKTVRYIKDINMIDLS